MISGQPFLLICAKMRNLCHSNYSSTKATVSLRLYHLICKSMIRFCRSRIRKISLRSQPRIIATIDQMRTNILVKLLMRLKTSCSKWNLQPFSANDPPMSITLNPFPPKWPFSDTWSKNYGRREPKFWPKYIFRSKIFSKKLGLPLTCFMATLCKWVNIGI